MASRRSWAKANNPFWSKHVAAWYRSALEAEHYCRKHDLSTTSLMRWARHVVSADDLRKRTEHLRNLPQKASKRQQASWQLRDLRRTFATNLAALRIAPHIIERLLNHTLGAFQFGGEISAVAAIYNRHSYLEEMREAIEKWENYLTAKLASVDEAEARAA
jgi:hypothetical protein